MCCVCYLLLFKHFWQRYEVENLCPLQELPLENGGIVETYVVVVYLYFGTADGYITVCTLYCLIELRGYKTNF